MNAGGFANLQCIVGSGDLPINITWSHPGDHQVRSVAESQRPRTTTTKVADRVSMLTIEVLSADHAGNYTCIAKNPAATAEYTTALEINGPLYYIFKFL